MQNDQEHIIQHHDRVREDNKRLYVCEIKRHMQRGGDKYQRNTLYSLHMEVRDSLDLWAMPGFH